MIAFDEVMSLTRTVSSAPAFSDEECLTLYDLCCQMRPHSVVAEIGCQLGRTSSIIAQVGRDIGYHSIHIDPYTSQFEYLKGWIEMMHGIGNPFTLHCMRTDQVHRNWGWTRGIDLLLIDGDHTTDGVQKDCEFAEEFLRYGGILAAHDFGQANLPDVEVVLRGQLVGPEWQELGVYGTLGVWRRR
jgi:predicted O-methyltransferase YrrM